MRISTFIAPGNKPCCQPLEIFELCADVRPGAVGSFISAIQPAACLVAIAWLSSVVLQCNCDSDTFSTLALPGLANDAVDFGERGRLARSFRRPAENLRATRERTMWCRMPRTQASRRDADWCDRDARAPSFELHRSGLGWLPEKRISQQTE